MRIFRKKYSILKISQLGMRKIVGIIAAVLISLFLSTLPTAAQVVSPISTCDKVVVYPDQLKDPSSFLWNIPGPPLGTGEPCANQVTHLALKTDEVTNSLAEKTTEVTNTLLSVQSAISQALGALSTQTTTVLEKMAEGARNDKQKELAGERVNRSEEQFSEDLQEFEPSIELCRIATHLQMEMEFEPFPTILKKALASHAARLWQARDERGSTYINLGKAAIALGQFGAPYLSGGGVDLKNVRPDMVDLDITHPVDLTILQPKNADPKQATKALALQKYVEYATDLSIDCPTQFGPQAALLLEYECRRLRAWSSVAAQPFNQLYAERVVVEGSPDPKKLESQNAILAILGKPPSPTLVSDAEFEKMVIDEISSPNSIVQPTGKTASIREDFVRNLIGNKLKAKALDQAKMNNLQLSIQLIREIEERARGSLANSARTVPIYDAGQSSKAKG